MFPQAFQIERTAGAKGLRSSEPEKKKADVTKAWAREKTVQGKAVKAERCGEPPKQW